MSPINGAFFSLASMGLSEIEIEIFCVIVIEGFCSFNLLSEKTGVSYVRLKQIINSLESKGFILIIPSRPVRLGFVLDI